MYLVAPLMECDYNDDFSYLDAYHGGLAFRNLRTGFIITLNYDATPTFPEAILPDVITYPNGTQELQWSNNGRVFIYSGLNETYWHTTVETMATINGTVYNKYMNWIKDYNTTHPWYNVWSVYDEYPGHVLVPNHECFAYVWESLQYLTGVGVIIGPSKAKVSFLALFSGSQPVKVEMSDPTTSASVIKFYVLMNKEIHNYGFLGFMEVITKMVFYSDFYIHVDTDYYRVELQYPWAGTFYENTPTPGHT